MPEGIDSNCGQADYDTTRPLLQVEDPMERIRTLMEKRAPVYEACADVILEASDLTLEEITEKIERNGK